VEETRELTINSQRGENEQLVLSISDTGVGLPPQQADQILQRLLLPPNLMAPAWDLASADPSWSRMAVGCGLLTTLPAAQVFISPCPAGARRSRLPSVPARLSFPSVQTVECALQPFKLLSSFAKFAFRRQALVVGQVLRGFRNERIKIRCGLG
jgi:hypothetical protein